MIAHVVDRLTIGGMENGIVNLINLIPDDRYRHAVICLRSPSEFLARIVRKDVVYRTLDKKPGKDPALYWRFFRLLKELKPAIVHTRNLPTIDLVLPAALAGVPCRVHGEHGRDMVELAGGNRKYNLIRRTVSPFVHRYIAVSRDIETWLQGSVRIPSSKIAQIYNGVDISRFHPRGEDLSDRRRLGPSPEFAHRNAIVVGTVGRMAAVKDQITLVDAFIGAVTERPRLRDLLRLVVVGEGELRSKALAMLGDAALLDIAWLPGSSDEVPAILRAMDIFVLPSLNEGISNTVLEAMASGLPVIATRVGGNPELVIEEETGQLVPPADPASLRQAILRYVDDPDLLSRHRAAGRKRAEAAFGLELMVDAYLAVYDEVRGAFETAASNEKCA